jgi:hypothetical protein
MLLVFYSVERNELDESHQIFPSVPPQGEPRPIEEYTYVDLKLKARLSDEDFDYRNPEYSFRRSFEL